MKLNATTVKYKGSTTAIKCDQCLPDLDFVIDDLTMINSTAPNMRVKSMNIVLEQI